MFSAFKFLLVLILIVFSFATVAITSSPAYADVWVNGYTKKDGTRVEGYYRSDPDGIVNNNWSVEGNTNPYTGVEGTKKRQDTSSTYTPTTQSSSLSTYRIADSSSLIDSSFDYIGVITQIIGFAFMSFAGFIFLGLAYYKKL